MRLNRATIEYYESIIAFYDDVTDRTLFLDWVLFANMKSVRLPGTEHMDAAYHQKRYHFVQSLWGMLIGLIPSLVGAGLYSWIIQCHLLSF